MNVENEIKLFRWLLLTLLWYLWKLKYTFYWVPILFVFHCKHIFLITLYFSFIEFYHCLNFQVKIIPNTTTIMSNVQICIHILCPFLWVWYLNQHFALCSHYLSRSPKHASQDRAVFIRSHFYAACSFRQPHKFIIFYEAELINKIHSK